ncbi:hypothetical protein, partial [Pseudomonas sp.]|uniref:hypothetical protein n=1 Tax=Pseudomonas sp. TaxID=306 RepID=UPI0028A9C550
MLESKWASLAWGRCAAHSRHKAAPTGLWFLWERPCAANEGRALAGQFSSIRLQRSNPRMLLGEVGQGLLGLGQLGA